MADNYLSIFNDFLNEPDEESAATETGPESVTFSSTAIASAEYDSSDESLTVNFTDGTSFDYSGVPAETWAAFKSAPSAGRFFNANIRNSF